MNRPLLPRPQVALRRRGYRAVITRLDNPLAWEVETRYPDGSVRIRYRRTLLRAVRLFLSQSRRRRR